MMFFLNIFFLVGLFTAGTVDAECITSDNVRLRVAPSKYAAVTWKVRKYFPVKKIGETEYWMNVIDLEGDKHWVAKLHVTKKYHCAIVKVSEARIKEEPGKRAKDKYKESANKYETFKFMSAKRGWIQVKDVHGDIGWIPYRDLWVD
jgi:SH3-like domain-containing protein